MKKFPSFLAGVLTTVIIGSLSISALAASGVMTISVNPINIQVNGATFAPKDVNGKSVPVFAYNGTTYAPLRALAEAYGLEVGYDATTNMATVNDPDAKIDLSSNPVYSQFDLLEFNGELYSIKEYSPLRYAYVSHNNGETFVFCDKTLVGETNPAAWTLQSAMSLYLAEDYTITQNENPYAYPFIESSSYGDFINNISAGKDPIQYLSATESYEPQWIEYNGKRIYNSKVQKGYSNEGGIRRYDGCINLEDALNALGINASISVKMVDGLECLVLG